MGRSDQPSRTGGPARKGGSGGKGGDCPEGRGEGAEIEGEGIEDVGDAIRRRPPMGRVMSSMMATIPVMILTGTGRADLIAAWGFNDLDSAPVWMPADHGEGWIDLGSLHASSHLYAGTELNAPFGWGAGEAMGLQGPGVESGSWLLGIESGPGGLDMHESVLVSFAARRSETGFDQVMVESWSGGSWTMIDVHSIDTEWGLHVGSPVSIDPVSGLLLRLTMKGSESGLGTIRFDNLRIDTVPVPSPGGAALLGVGGLGGFAGRRRR
ncbi:MAG: hypothetical protein CMJ34_01495 [Phycisphaerae bacterium]|nr:hypothetical protein [Phycisphaerae bacterium]